MNPQGIFITGCPRSGTTLLQSIIASHSQIHTAPETSFFSRIIPRLGVEYSNPEKMVDLRAIELVREDFSTMTGIELPSDFAGDDADISVRNLFERLMAYFNRDGKPIWVEKTTLHAKNLHVIKRFYPEARIVNVIRDPVACVGSMSVIRPISFSDLRIRYITSLYELSRLWNDCVSMSMEFPCKDQVMHVSYEGLVESPEETVRNICGFLKIQFEPDMLESFHHAAKNIFSEAGCPWQKKNLSSGVSSASIYKWRARLGPAKTWLIQRYTLRLATSLGYYQENMNSSRLLLLLAYAKDQVIRLVSATRIEILVRKTFVRVIT